jgi:hypothetical protein
MASENQEGTNTNVDKILQHPIPPPTHETQYRAIGLVWGVYQPQEQLTRGEMILPDEIRLETVLLGRVISVVKKHINLEDPHLWVVYPRTRQKQDYLHLQIVGVWEPKTLKESSQRADQLQEETVSRVNSQAGYFSLRGEVIFYSEAEQKIILKIQRYSDKKSSFFKLRVNGTLPDESEKLGWFWDIEAQLKGEELVVTQAEKIAPISPKGKRDRAPKSRFGRTPRKNVSPSQETGKPSSATKKPKPVPRRKKQRSQGNPNSEDN